MWKKSYLSWKFYSKLDLIPVFLFLRHQWTSNGTREFKLYILLGPEEENKNLCTFVWCVCVCVRAWVHAHVCMSLVLAESATPQTAAASFPCSLGFPGKNTGAGCRFLLQGTKPTYLVSPALVGDSLPVHHVGSPPLTQNWVIFKGTDNKSQRSKCKSQLSLV